MTKRDPFEKLNNELANEHAAVLLIKGECKLALWDDHQNRWRVTRNYKWDAEPSLETCLEALADIEDECVVRKASMDDICY